MLLRDYTKPELIRFLENCNFTESEKAILRVKIKGQDKCSNIL